MYGMSALPRRRVCTIYSSTFRAIAKKETYVKCSNIAISIARHHVTTFKSVRNQGKWSFHLEGGFRPTKPVYAWRGHLHCCVVRVGVPPARMGWCDVTSARLCVEHDKSNKHVRSCISQGFDFSRFALSTFGSSGPTA